MDSSDALINREPVVFMNPEDGMDQSAVNFSAKVQKDNFLGGGSDKESIPKSSPDRLETEDGESVFLFRYENPNSENKNPNSPVSQDELVGSWFTDSPSSLKDYIKKKQPGGIIKVLEVAKGQLEELRAVNHPVAKDMDIEPVDNYIISEDLQAAGRTFPLEVATQNPKKFLFGDWRKVDEEVSKLVERVQASETHGREIEEDNPDARQAIRVIKELRDIQNQDIKPLYRGVWADTIKDGSLVPVGGSIFKDDLDIIMEVDTEWIKDKTENFTRERLDQLYDTDNGQILKKWVEDNGIKIDPKLLHHLLYVLKKTRLMLEVGDESVAVSRKDLYLQQRNAKLSEFIGQSECAEQAVVGKLLLDKIGIKSTFMEGVHVDSKESDPFDHSFLLLDDPQGDGSLVFDIARPKASVDGYPRVLRSEKKLDYSTFVGKDNYVVPTTDIYNGTTIYYGVGHSSLLQDVNFEEW